MTLASYKPLIVPASVLSCESATEPTDGVIPASSSAKTSAVPTDDESAIYRDPDLLDDAGIRPVGFIVVAVVLTAGPMVTVDPMAADATVTVVVRAGVLVRCQNREGIPSTKLAFE